MFLKNKSIIFKIRRSKVTDYAALSFCYYCKRFSKASFSYYSVSSGLCNSPVAFTGRSISKIESL